MSPPYVPVPRPRLRSRAYLTLDEWRQLLTVARQRGQYEHTLVRLIYECALRSCEPSRFRLDHCALLHERPPRLYVPRGKDSTNEWVVISDGLARLLHAWVLAVYPDPSRRRPAAFVFPGRQRWRGRLRDCGVSRHVVYDLIKDLGCEAGLDARLITPHALKRSRGQHLFDAANAAKMTHDEMLASVARVLGHREAATSLRWYLAESGHGKDLREQVLRAAMMEDDEERDDEQ